MAKRKAAGTRGRKTSGRSGAARSRKAAGTRGRSGAAARKRASRKRTARKAARKTAARKTVARKTAHRKAAARKATPRRATGKLAAKRTRSAARTRAKTRTTAATRAASPRPARTPTPRPAPAAAARPPRAAAPPRKAPALTRARRTVVDEDVVVPTPPSTLDLDRSASAVRSGRRELREKFDDHNETSPALTGGDVDADWESAYSVGDEAPGGDNPTPDQDIVDDIGRAVGVEYQDNEELKGEEKILRRDRHRWELDPASSEDYEER